MALGDSYATVEELEARLGKANNGSFAALLDAASRSVEAFTRRQFNKTDTASARRFRALDPERLPTDDFYTTQDLVVTIDGETWDGSTYDPRPWNGVVDGIGGWPFFNLFAVGRCWPWSRRAVVQVTARWGWNTVPAGVAQATLLVATRLAQAANVGGNTGVVQSEAIDGYSVTYGTVLLATMEEAGVPAEMVPALPYRRKRFGVA